MDHIYQELAIYITSFFDEYLNARKRYRNLLIVATLKPLDVTLNNELSPLKLKDREAINTDNKPILEALNASANQTFRTLYLNNYILRNY